MAMSIRAAGKKDNGLTSGGLTSALAEWKECLLAFERAETKAETEFAVMRLEAARRRLRCLREKEQIG
ncbi:MAG: hypothetical protein K6G56_04410 [Clostridiales bacterium]|nr:hypothetical protein [Clostridiales bacterium]